MVADVRFKILMRLRAFIADMGRLFAENADLRAKLRGARNDPEMAAELKAYWIGRLKSEFPGCGVDCTPHRIYLTLPEGYPTPQVPISEVYPAAYRPALFGVSAKPEF